MCVHPKLLSTAFQTQTSTQKLLIFCPKGNGSTTESHFPILIYKKISVFTCMPVPSKEDHSQNVLESKNVRKVSRTKVKHRHGKNVFELPCNAGASWQ